MPRDPKIIHLCGHRGKTKEGMYTYGLPDTNSFNGYVQCGQAALCNQPLMNCYWDGKYHTASSCLTYEEPKGGLFGKGVFGYWGS